VILCAVFLTELYSHVHLMPSYVHTLARLYNISDVPKLNYVVNSFWFMFSHVYIFFPMNEMYV
jgi:hypothetical protein